MFGPLILALAGIGALSFLRATYTFYNFLAFYLITPSRPLHTYKRPGTEPTYALVTGASAGIGLGIARALVQQGFGVILLGHLPDELSSAAVGLRELCPNADIRTLVLNAQTSTVEEVEAAVASISHLRITILVNNVASIPIAPPQLRPFATFSLAEAESVLDANTRFMTRITLLMMPILSRKHVTTGKTCRSLIINMSSGGYFGVPMVVMYSATKAFNWGLSCGLAREFPMDESTRHIDSVCIMPGNVVTQSNPTGVIDWKTFGQCIVNRVDGAVARNIRFFSPWWRHGLEAGIGDLLPESVITNSVQKLLAEKAEIFEETRKKKL